MPPERPADVPGRLRQAQADLNSGRVEQVAPADLADTATRRALLTGRRPLAVTATWLADWHALGHDSARTAVLDVAVALHTHPSHPSLGATAGPDGQTVQVPAGERTVHATPVVGGVVLLAIT
jgi:hypothetical protein